MTEDEYKNEEQIMNTINNLLDIFEDRYFLMRSVGATEKEAMAQARRDLIVSVDIGCKMNSTSDDLKKSDTEGNKHIS